MHDVFIVPYELVKGTVLGMLVTFVTLINSNFIYESKLPIKEHHAYQYRLISVLIVGLLLSNHA